MPDKPSPYKQFNFDGEWLPDLDPTKLGPGNYRKLQNMRYTDGGPEGVLGDTKINTTALTTYTNIRTGHQLRSDRTLKSYVLVHAQDSSGNGVVYQNQTTIPDQGDFEGTVLHTDATDHGLGRFSDAPGGNVAYCNEKESMIWAGNEMRIGAFYLTTDGTYDGTENPIDRTEAINNTLDDTANVASIGSQKWWILLTTRPLKGVKYYVKTANDTTSTLAAKYYNGSWTAVSSGSDGTSTNGIALAQTGTYSFASTTSDAKPFHYQGNYLYAYQFQLSAGTATISHVSADAPFQSVKDVWDGVYRQPIQVQASINGKSYDYTLAANETSNTDIPIGADFGATDTTDSWVIMFDERMAGIRFTMLAGLVNTTGSVPTVKYWNGTAYVDTANSDGTAVSGKTLGQTGLMAWDPVAASSETKQTLYGTTGYAYEITFSVLLSGAAAAANVVADLITGVPAQNTVQAFRFASKFKNRLLLCGNKAAKEGGRVDYTLTNGPDVHNGEESSMQGLQSLYFGGVEDLTCGVELYNRFGSNIYATWLGLKNNETYLLTGNGPEDYRIYPISYTVGCPAPETLAAAELGFEMAENVVRNIAIWLDFSGPVIFDGAVIHSIKKVAKYFDPAESVCINFDSIAVSRGWYDPSKREYNLQIPSGSGQTTNNVWLVYDLIRKRWFTKYTGTAENIQCAWSVRDTYGTNYIYGGVDTGYMMRLENGTSYDGAGIEQIVEVGDFWPTGSIWDISQITRIKLIAKRITEDHSVGVTYYSDTSASSGVGLVWTDTNDFEWTDTDDFEWTSPEATSLSLNLDEGLNRLVRTTKRLTDAKGWTHGFGFTLTTTDATKGFKPIAWGIEYNRVRADN